MGRTIIVNERQAQLIKEQKELLTEYYVEVSGKEDTRILKNMRIYIYGEDRKYFTPHCHVKIGNDVECEYSLLNFTPILTKGTNGMDKSKQVKGLPVKYIKMLQQWLSLPSVKDKNTTNYARMLKVWDECNGGNTIRMFLENHKGVNVCRAVMDYLKCDTTQHSFPNGFKPVVS